MRGSLREVIEVNNKEQRDKQRKSDMSLKKPTFETQVSTPFLPDSSFIDFNRYDTIDHFLVSCNRLMGIYCPPDDFKTFIESIVYIMNRP